MNFDFLGQTVLVTGAGHGFGRAIALAFYHCGARVFISDVNQIGLQETVKLAENHMDAQIVDVTREDEVSSWVERIGYTTERIDVLVNNAGGVLGQVGRPLEEIRLDDWHDIFAVNVDGAFLCARSCIPWMKKQNQGRIINISSGAGLGVSFTGIQAYASAKAAQIGLTRQLAHELGTYGITVNTVAPGFVRSNPTTEKQWESYGQEGQQRLIENIAMRRLGTPEDIAYAVLFFASEEAGWVTGQVLSVDGGK